MIRMLFALATILIAGNASAALFGQLTEYRIVPVDPVAGEPVFIEVRNPLECYWGTATIAVDLDGHLITGNFDQGLDATIGCQPEESTPRLFAIGALPRGTYRVDIGECNYPQGPAQPSQCGPVGSEMLVVGGGGPVQVPAGAPAGWAVLVVALIVAMAAVRTRPA